MKRGEKVKDIVDIRPFTHLHDFAADAGLTLASYHFTDITSDLMGKWIERISDVRPGRGDAVALAGSRGVGKSHFVSVLTAIASRAELRSRIQDPHVLSRADLLTKRPMSVASVRRGSGTSLLAELRSALAAVFHVRDEALSESLQDLLSGASDLAGETRLLIFVDTALGRSARVDRDDGAVLSEIAEAARSLGIFVGITLDDDISGADGPNSSIARSFHIDFLDQEHLYKIVDRHIFVKDNNVRPILKEIYAEYRKAIPGFGWSEQRFLSLYPLHPATIEIAPLIRLFIQDFALLGFASEAGVKVLGRPADSLIGLDEMFDSVEARLRKVPELSAAFSNYDLLEQQVVSKTAVQLRLQAKLCLKGLFMLSLDGQGVTAPAVAASMMIFDQDDPAAAPGRVAELLDSFAASALDAVSRSDESGDPRYRINLGVNEDLEKAIKHLRSELTDNDIWEAIVDHLAEKFPEIHKRDEMGQRSTTCTIEWRGSLRRGEIDWFGGGPTDSSKYEHLDWKLLVRRGDAEQKGTDGGAAGLYWQLGSLTAEDRETVARYHLIKTHSDIKEQLGAGTSNIFQMLSIAVEKISKRVLFTDAAIASDGKRYPVESDSGSHHNLAHLFTRSLAPILDERFPEHPIFAEQLGVKQVSGLISEFFGGTDQGGSEVQAMARAFLLPLGLAVEGPECLIPASKDELHALPHVRKVLDAMIGSETLLLSRIAELLHAEPVGLTRESQQLILASLVAQREVEFVTVTGNRINHRSLDLHVIWDDVVGIASPSGKVISNDQLLSWARTVTARPDIGSISSPGDVAAIRDSFGRWVNEWNEDNILDEYDRLPDESLNASGWRRASAVRKSLGAVTDHIQQYLSGGISLEDCLESVAELFLGSEEEFIVKKNDLRQVQTLTREAKLWSGIDRYLSASDPTNDHGVEAARSCLLELKAQGNASTSEYLQGLEKAWKEFQGAYSEYYGSIHHEVFGSADRKAELRELLSSGEWQKFEVKSLSSSLDLGAKSVVDKMRRELQYAGCGLDPAGFLIEQPFCGCGMSLGELIRLSDLSKDLRSQLEGIADGGSGGAENGHIDRSIREAAKIAEII